MYSTSSGSMQYNVMLNVIISIMRRFLCTSSQNSILHLAARSGHERYIIIVRIQIELYNLSLWARNGKDVYLLYGNIITKSESVKTILRVMYYNFIAGTIAVLKSVFYRLIFYSRIERLHVSCIDHTPNGIKYYIILLPRSI